MAAGQLRPDADVVALAPFIGAIIQGMAVQARDGADKATLNGIASMAIAQLKRSRSRPERRSPPATRDAAVAWLLVPSGSAFKMYDTGIRPEKMRSVPETSSASTRRLLRGTDGGMALQSMTGFARAGAELDGAAIVWEVKSVNGKGLEPRFRLAPGYERIEQPARQAIQKRFSRGKRAGDADRRACRP